MRISSSLSHRFLVAGLAVVLLTALSADAFAQRGRGRGGAKAETFTVDPETAGTIVGKVVMTGTPPKETPINMKGTPACADQHTEQVFTNRVVSNDKGELKDVFVWIKTGLEGKNFEVVGEPPVLDQKGCVYEPTVFGIQAGQTLRILNSDPTLHNVHAIGADGKGKDYFNLAMPQKGMELKRDDFKEADVLVKFKCEVHPWMFAWGGVVGHPYFATTDGEGNFKLENVPAGKYTVAAWQRRGGFQEMEVTVEAKAEATANFTYAFEAAAPAEAAAAPAEAAAPAAEK